MRISKSHIIWNYVGTIINNGLNIFILPLVLHLLTTKELGLWYVFGSIAALVNLFDFGFSPTIMRNITYSFGGATILLPEGVPPQNLTGFPNYPLLSALISASMKIYLFISSIAGILLGAVGTLYIQSLAYEQSSEITWAWLVYALAVFINLFYSYWIPLLKGVGGIKESNQALLFSRIVYLVLSVTCLMLGLGLLGLSVAYLISGIVMRILAKRYFYRIVQPDLLNVASSLDIKTLLKIIWPNAKKSGVVTVGAWLITRATTLLCSTFLGLEVTAMYGLSLQLISFAISFSALMFNSYIPELAYLQINMDKERYINILSRGVVVQWGIGIAGILGISLLGDYLMNLIGSNSLLLPRPILFLLSVVLFLEQNHSTFATTITLTNHVPFVKSAIYSGIAIVVFGFLFVKYTALGILGLIIVQGLVQLVYNNWYWPRLVFMSLHMSPMDMVRTATANIKR